VHVGAQHVFDQQCLTVCLARYIYESLRGLLYSITLPENGHRCELTFVVKLVDSPSHEISDWKNASLRRNLTECNRDDCAERLRAHEIRSYADVSEPIIIGKACIEPSEEPRLALPPGFFYASTTQCDRTAHQVLCDLRTEKGNGEKTKKSE
jgi:hypothetical protein